jgi:catechol 2,3-dioxygenase
MTDPIAFSPRRLAHVNLYVSDLERSVSFYEGVCGLHLVRREPAIRAAFHSNGNTHHDIGMIEVSKGQDRIGRDGQVQIAATRGTAASLNHLGWEMEDEAQLVAAYGRMVAAGFKPLRLADHIISHSIYIEDPDGNAHEFYADAIPDWRRVFNPEQDDLVTSQWDPLSQAPSTAKNYPADPAIVAAPQAPLQPRSVTGAVIATHRMAEMQRFFSDVCGLATVLKSAGRIIYAGALGQPDLVLEEAAADAPTGLRMFSFQLLAPAEIAKVDGGAQSRFHEDGPRSSVVVADPDGFLVEFYYSAAQQPLVPLAA